MALAIVLALLPLAPADEQDALPGTQAEQTVCVLVRDARNGKPVAGVRVAQYLEDASETFLRAPLIAKTKTNEHGIAVVAWKTKPADCHWIFEAPGYAVHSEYGAFLPDVVELEPGRKAQARVFGPFGKPRAGVRVEYLLGCSHSPAVRTAVTDAAGRFELSEIDPRRGRLWIRGAGMASRFFEFGDGDLHADPGVELTGRIVDPSGKPVPRAFLGSHQEPRGPRIRADDQGLFRLPGYAPGEGFFARGPDTLVAYSDDTDVDAGRPFFLTVRERASGTVSGRRDPDAEDIAVRFAFTDAATGLPVAELSAALRRAGDGRLFHLIDGVIEAPAGRYGLRVGGPFAPYSAKPLTIDVKPGAEGPHRVAVTRKPRVAVEANGLPKHATLELVTAAALVTLPDSDIGLGADVPAVVRVQHHGIAVTRTLEPARAGKRTAKLEWPSPRRIVLGFTDRTVRIEGAWSRQEDGVLLTHARGPQTLVVDDAELGVQEVAVRIDAAEVKLPAKALRAPGAVRVFLPGGEPLREGRATVRDGSHEHEVDLAHGRSWCLRDGAHALLRRNGLFPLRRALSGDGPYELRWGTATLSIKLEEPGAGDFVVVIDGERFRGEDAAFTLRGLDPGRHTVLIGAEGRKTRAVKVVLVAGANAVVTTFLQSR